MEKILNIIKNPVLLLNNKKNKLKNIIEKEKIFDYLFNFTTKEYFIHKVKLVNFYENNGKKIDISKKNLINSKDNKELFLNLIVEKIVRDNKFGLRLVTEEIDEYNFKSKVAGIKNNRWK